MVSERFKAVVRWVIVLGACVMSAYNLTQQDWVGAALFLGIALIWIPWMDT